MTLTAMVAMTIAAGIPMQAGSTDQNQLTVYVRNHANVPHDTEIGAERLASSMFAAIGVRIEWRSGEPSAAKPGLVIELATNTPKAEKPGALAYATPYEGTHIVVFWDRMWSGLARRQLLAHVMVHEITHILEGVCRHSDAGIMKAEWTDRDYREMLIRPLTFAAVDVVLIHDGLAARNSRSGLKLTANQTPAGTAGEE